MQDYISIEVPRESANDDEVRLVEWLVQHGQKIGAGDVVCVLESSKTAFECAAPEAGYIFLQKEAGQDVEVGEIIALISASATAPVVKPRTERESGSRKAAALTDPAVKISAKALRLIERHHIDPAVFAGMGLVREKHVQRYLETRTDFVTSEPVGEIHPLSPVQHRTARVLTHSKQSIPHSYLSRHIAADLADANVAAIATAHDIMLSISDCLIVSVAKALAEHPKVNASWSEKGLRFHKDINVGFALNQADGTLIVPVVKNVIERDLTSIVGAVRGFQKKSLRAKLTAEDLTGGHCTVTSLVGSGVHQIIPIIYPDQSVIVAIADKWGHGALSFYTVTLAFDHRVLNGTEAGLFLTTVTDRLLNGR